LIDVSYWPIIGTIYLLILTYQDYKTMMCDDRLNFFMLGLSLSLTSHTHPAWYYVILLSLVVFVLQMVLRKYKVLGGADISALTWIFYGFGLLGIFYFGWFAVFYLAIHLLFYLLLRTYIFVLKRWGKLSKEAIKIPYFAVILITYVFTCYLFGLY